MASRLNSELLPGLITMVTATEHITKSGAGYDQDFKIGLPQILLFTACLKFDIDHLVCVCERDVRP